MKRTISWLLVLVMVLSLFAGCANETEPTAAPDAPTEVVAAEDTNLADAIAYLKTYYKGAGGLTPADFQRLGTVRVGETAYEIVYTVDCDESAVKIVKGTDGMVTIDVNEESDVEVPYVLTATITGTDGATASLTWDHVVPVSMAGRTTEIVDAAYALADGEALGYEATLKGVITSIDTPYSTDYKNITVTIQVEGREDKPIMCYRLKGEGADKLAVGDTITVTGTLKNYKGTIEFDAGCNLDEVISGGGSSEAPSDPAEIMDAAYALEKGKALPYVATLTGQIHSINTSYSKQYNNISVSIWVEGSGASLMCFRLKGDGVDKIGINDIITVTGTIKNYNGTIEFDAGCQLVSWEDKPAPVVPEDPKVIVDAAYRLWNRASLTYSCDLTGKITAVNTLYSEVYKNITVTMVIEGREDKPIKCYRLCGEGVDDLMVGDTITVYGVLKNYNGEIEFAQGCKLKKVKRIERPDAPETLEEQLAEAAALENKTYLPYATTFTGKIANIPAYDDYYDSYSFNVTDGTHTIYCYSLEADGFTPEKGDTVKVTGNLTAYNGTPQFDYNSKMSLVEKGEGNPEEEVKPLEIPKDATQAEIVKLAYTLEVGNKLADEATLTGVISQVNTAYDSQYKNVTVTIVVGGDTKHPIMCYRLKGEGADMLGVGDTVTVTGTIKNYNGTIEFDAGCKLDSYTESEDKVVVKPLEIPEGATPAEIVKLAYTLEVGNKLADEATLTGVISQVNTAYDSQYKNVTVTIVVGGDTKHPIMCYRMKGTGADVIGVGDTVTVTGTIKNYNGTIEFDSGCTLDSYKKVETEPEETEPEETEPEETTPVLSTPAEIMDAAYALGKGESLDGTYTLSGKITSVDDAYSDRYKNITVTIQVDGSGKTIQCYRLKGTGADIIAVGDTVTVTGSIKNYDGKVQFNTGCALDAYTHVEPTLETPAEIMDAAYALETDASLDGNFTLSGKITSVDDAYSDQYKNVTVTIQVDGSGKTIQCYRMKGTGADIITVGDTITVSGSIKNYKGKVQFNTGCKLDSYTHIEKEPEETEPEETEPEETEPEETTPVLSTPAEIMDAAYALETNASLDGTYTLSGKITSVDSAYSSQYKNVTVTIQVDGSGKTLQCFRLKGTGADVIAVGDTITVTGTIKNYNGTIEFDSGCTLDSYKKAE